MPRERPVDPLTAPVTTAVTTAVMAPWTALVPLRAGSKGLPGKNTRLLAGRPLYLHAVAQALEAGATRVILSTDIEAVLQAAHPPGVEALRRPAPLCADDTPMGPVVLHVLRDAVVQGTVVLLQPTSPLRRAQHILQGLALHAQGRHELVMSVTEAERGVLKWGRLKEGRFVPLAQARHVFSNRQSLPPVVRPNGAVYVFDAAGFQRRGGFETEHIGAFEMDADASQDIDTLADFERCERLLAARSGPPDTAGSSA